MSPLSKQLLRFARAQFFVSRVHAKQSMVIRYHDEEWDTVSKKVDDLRSFPSLLHKVGGTYWPSDELGLLEKSILRASGVNSSVDFFMPKLLDIYTKIIQVLSKKDQQRAMDGLKQFYPQVQQNDLAQKKFELDKDEAEQYFKVLPKEKGGEPILAALQEGSLDTEGRKHLLGEIVSYVASSESISLYFFKEIDPIMRHCIATSEQPVELLQHLMAEIKRQYKATVNPEHTIKERFRNLYFFCLELASEYVHQKDIVSYLQEAMIPDCQPECDSILKVLHGERFQAGEAWPERLGAVAENFLLEGVALPERLLSNQAPLLTALFLSEQPPEVQKAYDNFCGMVSEQLKEDSKSEELKKDPKFFLFSHQGVILQLMSMMGADAFTWLSNTFKNSVPEIGLFLKNMPILPLEEISFLTRYFERHKNDIMGDQKDSWKKVMLGFGVLVGMGRRQSQFSVILEEALKENSSVMNEAPDSLAQRILNELLSVVFDGPIKYISEHDSETKEFFSDVKLCEGLISAEYREYTVLTALFIQNQSEPFKTAVHDFLKEVKGFLQKARLKNNYMHQLVGRYDASVVSLSMMMGEDAFDFLRKEISLQKPMWGGFLDRVSELPWAMATFLKSYFEKHREAIMSSADGLDIWKRILVAIGVELDIYKKLVHGMTAQQQIELYAALIDRPPHLFLEAIISEMSQPMLDVMMSASKPDRYFIEKANVMKECLPQPYQAYPLMTGLFLRSQDSALTTAYAELVDSQGEEVKKLFSDYELVVLQLMMIMGRDVFPWLQQKLTQSPFALEQLLKNMSILPISEIPAFKSYFNEHKDRLRKDEFHSWENILLGVGLKLKIDECNKISESSWLKNPILWGKEPHDFMEFVLDQVDEGLRGVSFRPLFEVMGSCPFIFWPQQATNPVYSLKQLLEKFKILPELSVYVLSEYFRNQKKSIEPEVFEKMSAYLSGQDKSSQGSLLEVGSGFKFVTELFLRSQDAALTAAYAELADSQDEKVKKLFSDYELVILQLVMMMGRDAFSWLQKKLEQSPLALEQLLKNISILPISATLIFRSYFNQHKDRLEEDGFRSWEHILLGIGLKLKIDQYQEIRESSWLTSPILLEKNPSDFMEFVLSKIDDSLEENISFRLLFEVLGSYAFVFWSQDYNPVHSLENFLRKFEELPELSLYVLSEYFRNQKKPIETEVFEKISADLSDKNFSLKVGSELKFVTELFLRSQDAALTAAYVELVDSQGEKVKKLFSDYGWVVVQLVMMMGGDAFSWLRQKLAQSPFALEQLLKNISILPISSTLIFRSYFNQHKDRLKEDGFRSWEHILLGVGLKLKIDECKKVSESLWLTSSELLDKQPDDFMKFVLGKIDDGLREGISFRPLFEALGSCAFVFWSQDYNPVGSLEKFIQKFVSLSDRSRDFLSQYLMAQARLIEPEVLERMLICLNIQDKINKALSLEAGSGLEFFDDKSLDPAILVQKVGESLLPKAFDAMMVLARRGGFEASFFSCDLTELRLFLPETYKKYPLMTAIFLSNNATMKAFYDEFFEKFVSINSRNEAQPQHVRDPEAFFKENEAVILQLTMIMGQEAFVWLKQSFATTVLTLERFVKNIPLLPQEAVEFLRDYFNSHKKEVMGNLDSWKNILIAMGVQLAITQRTEPNLTTDDQLKAYDFSGDLESLENRVINGLLHSVAKDIELIEDELQSIQLDKLLEKMTPSMLSSVLAVQDKIKSTPYAKVYKAMLRCDLTGQSWQECIDREGLNGLREHNNEKIRQVLSEKGVDPKKALNYQEELQFIYEPHGRGASASEAQLVALHSFLEPLKEKVEAFKPKDREDHFKNSQNKRITGILEAIEKITKQINKSDASVVRVLSDNMGQEKPLSIINNNLILIREAARLKEITLPAEFQEFSGHFIELYQAVEGTLQGSEKSSNTKLSSHRFIVQQWNKDDPRTLLLGNYVGCCLATDGPQVSAIIQRRMDDALLFHVVVDVDTKLPVALLWLYFAIDKNGDPILVVNFPEVAARYGANEDARKVLFNALLSFTADYCEKNGIKHFYANKPGYGWNTKDFDGLGLQEKEREWDDKLGGAFVPGPQVGDSVTRTLDHYYLKSLNESAFKSISSESFTPEQKARFMPIEKHMGEVVKSNKSMNSGSLLKMLEAQFSPFFPKGEHDEGFKLLCRENFEAHQLVMPDSLRTDEKKDPGMSNFFKTNFGSAGGESFPSIIKHRER